jgi:hypothetical protein
LFRRVLEARGDLDFLALTGGGQLFTIYKRRADRFMGKDQSVFGRRFAGEGFRFQRVSGKESSGFIDFPELPGE